MGVAEAKYIFWCVLTLESSGPPWVFEHCGLCWHEQSPRGHGERKGRGFLRTSSLRHSVALLQLVTEVLFQIGLLQIICISGFIAG